MNNALSKNEFDFFISTSWLTLLWLRMGFVVRKPETRTGSLSSLRHVVHWRSGFFKGWWLANMAITIHSSWVFRVFLRRLPFAREVQSPFVVRNFWHLFRPLSFELAFGSTADSSLHLWFRVSGSNLSQNGLSQEEKGIAKSPRGDFLCPIHTGM